jgi:hypothetical protein
MAVRETWALIHSCNTQAAHSIWVFAQQQSCRRVHADVGLARGLKAQAAGAGP